MRFLAMVAIAAGLTETGAQGAQIAANVTVWHGCGRLLRARGSRADGCVLDLCSNGIKARMG